MKLIGVDIGGSHISSAQVEVIEGKASFYHYHESKVDSSLTAEALIETWAETIRKSINKEEDFRVGIAMPGPFDYQLGVSKIREQGKMISLYGKSVKNLLAEALQIAPRWIVFVNDAEAFLLGESLAGVGRNFKNSIGITLGTGLGSAFKIEQEVKDAKLWTAPFRDGIAEEYLGTGWFVDEVKRKSSSTISGVKDLADPNFNAELAESVFADFGKAFGEFLFPYLIRMQIEGVVLGGKISLAAERFLPYTEEYLKFHRYPLTIMISALGDKSALVGAIQPIFTID